ncbi:Metallo-peptidase family M12B Reprolysin-like [Agreia bicolorata]|uniref:Metallo-peptidase family M12B Reprolysin-like n=1 Tax=Agreia bicolorata TaxID=110935 RepID=A0A1T4XJU7_9MICO|nr:Ig-like domain-containing protein [Agreia bicolorata]KJC64992.1 hypothetical protein TZ00_05140 [Agreia bicolorata]SKA89800.1 Metallo-peptidase family M12B Reprolysin-like [Agreia bicolorata]
MTPSLRRTATIGTATLGLSLALAGAVPSASAETADVAAPAVATSTAPAPLNAGADKYELAAEYSGLTADEVRSLEQSGAIKVSDNGFILHIDDATTSGSSDTLNMDRQASELLAAPIPGSATGGSRPGAPVTIYLDFDGEVLEGTQWNIQANSESLTFSAAAAGADTAFRDAVWAVVAEDYAPFNVNVTTANPGTDALVKSSADDNVYGSHVIITDSYTEVLPDAADSSGIAWGGGTGSDFLSGAFVFTEGLGGAAATTKNVGNTASHESGHNFGLLHDGIDGSTTGEYYYPTEGLWAPTMGASFDVPLSQWSNGGYAGATNTEPDLDVITDRSSASAIFVNATTPDGQPYEGPVCVAGDANANNPQPGDQFFVPNNDTCEGDLTPLTLNFSYTDRADYATDEVGDSAAESTTLENDGTFSTESVIGTPDDVDVYGVIAAAGPFTATVDVADIAPNLDSKLTLTDSQGNVIAESSPATTRVSADTAAGLGATITTTVETGAYYLTVDGVGAGDPTTATPDNSNGYTDYGSLGNYTLSGTAVQFVAEELVIETPVEGAKVVGGSTVDVTGTATPNVTVTLAAGGSNVTTVADADGKWASSVTANAFGNTEIVASQGFANLAVPGTDSVTVTAPVSAPVITNPANGTTTGSATPSISGTGIAGATVTVTVTDASGNVTTGQAQVDGNGAWELVLATPLPTGAYTITAVQTINGVTSGLTAPVSFSIDLTVTTGNGTDPANVGGTLAATGNDLFGSPFVLLAAGLLLGGVVTTSFAISRRRAFAQQS